MDNPRQIVARLLLRVERGGAWSSLALDHALRGSDLDAQGTAFASALFYGVAERRITLDACAAAHSKQPLKRLSPEVLCALRMGIYQLLYMDSVPDSAAVNESVELVRALRKGQASGFVNGVLRSFLRAGENVPLPGAPLSARLSVEYSCPQPLVEQWLEAYGEEAVTRFLADSLGRPGVAVRVNTLRVTSGELTRLLEDEGVKASPHPDLRDCLLLAHTRAVHELDCFRRGLMHVQDPSSQLCAGALDVLPGHRVLDACAAPGGKSFTLWQLMEGKGELVACDISEKRVGLIKKRCGEIGAQGIAALCRDMGKYHPDLGLFDRVLCDVPCSGYGVIRRKPEIKYKPLSEFADISSIQYKILETSSQYCKDGGRLIYSTCTLNPAENMEVAARFLREHPEFSPQPLGGLLGDAAQRTLMCEFGADGFFLAAFGKVGKA